MPTIDAMELPRPKNWQDFESIVRDALAQRWKSTTLSKNGRGGQKQKGVDIYGPDEIGRAVGIQCKLYNSPLKLKQVSDEVANAEQFKGQLTTLFIATTAERDATLQEKVRLLSDARVAQGKFAVALLYWDDIVASLLLNPAVFRTHYPQVVLDDPRVADKERLIGALELGWYGADLWAYIVLVYGEFGSMAQTDPDGLIANLRIIERRVQQLLPPSDASPILKSLTKVRKGCIKKKHAKSDWDPIEVYAKRVSTRLHTATSLLAVMEATVLELGLQLGRIYHHVDNRPSAKTRSDVQTKARNILGPGREAVLKRAFAKASSLTSGYSWATRIHTFLDQEIRVCF